MQINGKELELTDEMYNLLLDCVEETLVARQYNLDLYKGYPTYEKRYREEVEEAQAVMTFLRGLTATPTHAWETWSPRSYKVVTKCGRMLPYHDESIVMWAEKPLTCIECVAVVEEQTAQRKAQRKEA